SAAAFAVGATRAAGAITPSEPAGTPTPPAARAPRNRWRVPGSRGPQGPHPRATPRAPPALRGPAGPGRTDSGGVRAACRGGAARLGGRAAVGLVAGAGQRGWRGRGGGSGDPPGRRGAGPQGGAEGDLVQPAAQRVAAAQGVGLAGQGEEGGLEGVLGVGRV